MSERVVRSFSREYKLEVVKRMGSGENISALAREIKIKREVLYRWRDAHRLGGPAALRLIGRPSKIEATEMAKPRSTAGNGNDLAEACWFGSILARGWWFGEGWCCFIVMGSLLLLGHLLPAA